MQRPLAIGLIAIAAIVCVVAGCSTTGLRHLDADEFSAKAKNIDIPGSMNSIAYIGATRNRVYLEYTEKRIIGRGWKTNVYWTELDGLPPTLLNDLNARKP